MTHADLVAHAIRWLRTRTKLHGKHSVVFSELVTNHTLEVPDALGFDALGCSTLIECKASRSDFFRDKRKPKNGAQLAIGRHRYFMVPAGLVVAEETQAGWGLLYVGDRCVTVVRPAVERELSPREQRAETGLLAAVVRRHEIGVPWTHRTARFAPYSRARLNRFLESEKEMLRPGATPEVTP